MANRTTHACQRCSAPTRVGHYDAHFRHADGRISTVKDVPAALCVSCGQLWMSPDLLETLGLTEAACTFAILSDRYVQAIAARERVANRLYEGATLDEWAAVHVDHRTLRADCPICAPWVRASI